MAKTSGLTSANARALANMAFAAAGTTVGTAATGINTANVVPFTVDGIFFSKAAMTSTALAVPPGYPPLRTQPANTTMYYVLAFSAAGLTYAFQGSYAGERIEGPTSQGMSVYGDGQIPDVPDGFTPFAVMKVVTAGTPYVPGTTALTGLATFKDVSVLPVAGTF